MITNIDFLNKYNFTVIIAVCVLLFAWKLPRRKAFWVRLAVSLAVLIAFVVTYYLAIFPAFDFSASFDFTIYTNVMLLKYFGHCLIMILAVWFCFDCSLLGALFCMTTGYCVQHIAQKLYTFVKDWLADVFFPDWFNIIVFLLINAVVCALFYFLMMRMTGKRLGATYRIKIKNPVQMIVTIGALFVVIAADFKVGFTIRGEEARNLYTAVSITCALLAVLLEMSMLACEDAVAEKKLLKEILAQQREQFLAEKQNVDLVNIRCHDIRHQLRELGDQINPEALKKITEAIDVYDSKVEMGNEAISVVLAKYSLYSAQHGIRMTCMLDGARLNFIPAHELYSLFGNAVENAVHAVEKLPEEKRIVSVTENVVGNLLDICISNYYDGELTYDGELPTNNAEGHGYGIKSMRLIVENYGGRLSVRTTEDLFILDIFLSLPISTN